MISSHTLSVFPRERTGSRYAQRDRAAGRLPAVLYGHGKQPMSISLDTKQALAFFHAGEKVFSINVEGEAKDQTVMLKDLQFDYMGNNLIHVDLARVDLNEEIIANIHVKIIGDAIGLKTAGAILTHPTIELSVRCTVATLPDYLEVDISELEVGQTTHAGQVIIPEGVTLLSDEDLAVAAISVTKVQEEPTEGEAEAVEGEAASPEVLSEKKDDAGADVGKDGKDGKDGKAGKAGKAGKEGKG